MAKKRGMNLLNKIAKDKLFPLLDRLTYPLFNIPRKIELDNLKKILVIRLDRIGDLALSLPAIAALKYSLPTTHIAILVNDRTKGIVTDLPYIDRVIVYKESRSLIRNIKLILEIRKFKYDLVIDLIYSKDLLSAIIAFLSGAPLRVGFDTGIRRFCFTHKIIPERNEKYEVERNLEIMGSIGIKPLCNKIHSLGIKVDDRYFCDFKQENGIKDRDILIGIAPGIYRNVLNRRWPEERFAELAEELVRRYGAKIIFTGTQDHVELTNRIIDSIDIGAISMVGKTSLRQLCTIMSKLHLFIGGLIGPAHIAASFEVPSVILSGPVLVKRWMPHGERFVRISKDLPCIPCNDSNQCSRGDYACMREITVGEVLDGVKRLERYFLGR